MNSKKERVNPRIPSYVKKNLKQMGYKPSEALIIFHNQQVLKIPERYNELLLREEKLEQGIKTLTEELKKVKDEKKQLDMEFEQYDIEKTENYKLASDEVLHEIANAKKMVEVHKKYGYKLKKDKIKEICKKHNINLKIIISMVKKREPEAIGKYIEKI